MDPHYSAGLDGLLKQMQALAEADPAAALSLPREVYTSPELFKLESRKIFRKEWICVGRADEIPNTGDYFTTEIDSEPLLVVRQGDGDIAAMSNVCRHRMAAVAAGSGNAGRFSCPYHGWTYDIDGRLFNAPRMPKEPALDRDACRLPSVRTEIWLGFIYVNLDQHAKPLAPRLAKLQGWIKNYHVENFRTVWHKQEIWQCNWKVMTENFHEAYHVTTLHPETLLPYGSNDLLEELPVVDPGCWNYRQRVDPSYELVPLDPEIAIGNPDLGEHETSGTYICCIYPSHLFSLSWDFVYWLSLLPMGVDRAKIDWGVGGPVNLPKNQPSYANFPYPEFMSRVNAEDQLVVEAVQRGAASVLAAQGRLSDQELGITHFLRYLVDRLTSAS